MQQLRFLRDFELKKRKPLICNDLTSIFFKGLKCYGYRPF